MRKNIQSGAPWESTVGYSRAVRVGNHIMVAGTTAVDGRHVIGKGSPYQQTHYVLQKIKAALESSGARLEHVVRTRIFVTDISRWEEVGQAHGEIFKDIRPASTMVEVKALIHPDLMVEIEVDAIVG